jgi:hypothetical protein
MATTGVFNATHEGLPAWSATVAPMHPPPAALSIASSLHRGAASVSSSRASLAAARRVPVAP